jgi:outer membrane protein TolC
MLLVLGLVTGCSRAHYRTAADRETYPIIAERIVDPAYDIGRVNLEPAPASRLFDPYDPDYPPKPPDDPAAQRWMQRPGGMKGARGWYRDGAVDHVEPPGWEQTLGLDEEGVLQLNTDRAVEIALVNSREYQTALEGVYLTALALTLNRFEFDLRWFLRNNTTFEHFGSGPTESNTLTTNTNFGFERNLAAGGQLLVDFANSVVIEYVGDNRTQVRSTLLLSLVQPLLRNAGRAVRLESLTQAEREVLYAVRDFARFRKQFWAGIAVQDGSYLDLLLNLQTLRNQRANLKRQEEVYRLYNELFSRGRASVVELDQSSVSLQSARLSVIDAEAGLEAALDRFKIRLGVPPRIPVELDDAALDQFIVTNPAFEKLRDDLEAFQRERLKELDQAPPAKDLIHHFATLRDFADKAPAVLDEAAADLQRWVAKLAEPPPPKDDPEQRDRDLKTLENLKKHLPDIAVELKKIAKAIDTHQAGVTEATRKIAWEALANDTTDLLAQMDAAIAIQTQARINLIKVPQVEYAEAEALALAKANRLDLQNRLALVTDAWRQVRIAANALRSDLNVIAQAELATDPDHDMPFNFASEASRYAVGLRFDGPLNRLAERNAYRASLIAYQRARRAYMELSDQIELQVRQDLRQLNRLRLGFEISRQQLLSAARQFESARITLLKGGEKRGANDATTLNLLQALQSLLSARNDLAASYINFEQQRVQLLLDLELLYLDPVTATPVTATPVTATPITDRPITDRPGPGTEMPASGTPRTDGPGTETSRRRDDQPAYARPPIGTSPPTDHANDNNLSAARTRSARPAVARP